ncbi:DUF4328 domain-containing protein [Streptomyces althioticus]|uniref:protein kinase domain-containing protein n=1 Tax=Streptomyces althioticus TaxID=83380 RepID=UPI00378F70A2
MRGLASGLCAALADIHAAGLVHRDLKPSNVMITIDGPKVIDFGIVRALDDPTRGGLTSTGLIVGTPGFMAPEQIRGERLTEASDIFSLGAVLTFAASGKTAFETPGGQAHAIMYRVVHEEPDLTGVPNPLLPLIRDCLAKDPTARPPLDALRAREETQYPVRGPWLPAAVLAQLGQDAAQLLEREDPHTRATPDAALVSTPPMPHATVTEPARPVTAPITAPNTPQRPTHLSHEDEQPRRTLAEERNGRRAPGPSPTAVYVALALFTAVSVCTATVIMIGWNEDFPPSWGLANTAATWGSLQFVSGLGLIVCWLIWFARTRAIAEHLAPGRLRYRPSTAVLAWFIPVGNLYLPKQIANDIWHASSPPARPGAMAPAARLHLWWGFWLATLLTWPIFWWTLRWDLVGLEPIYDRSMQALGIYPADLVGYDLGILGWVSLILRLFVIPTAVMAARYIHRLTVMQRARLLTSAAIPPDPRRQPAWLIAGEAIVAAGVLWGIGYLWSLTG